MFFDKYCELCKQHNISPSAAAIEMGISKGTVSVWKNRGNTPQTPQLQKIAEYFGVTTDYLLGNEKKAAISQDGGPKDVKDILLDVKSKAAQGITLMYNGKPINERTMRAFEASLEAAITLLDTSQEE